MILNSESAVRAHGGEERKSSLHFIGRIVPFTIWKERKKVQIFVKQERKKVQIFVKEVRKREGANICEARKSVKIKPTNNGEEERPTEWMTSMEEINRMPNAPNSRRLSPLGLFSCDTVLLMFCFQLLFGNTIGWSAGKGSHPFYRSST